VIKHKRKNKRFVVHTIHTGLHIQSQALAVRTLALAAVARQRYAKDATAAIAAAASVWSCEESNVR